MKKNKLSDIKFSSVDLVNRGANQEANIMLYKSDNTPADDERHVLKKAFDYLKSIFGNDGPETIAKSDIVKEYDGYATQLLKSFDSIIDDTELNTDEKAEMMQKSIQEFSAFMTEAVPMWANSQSVAKSDKLSEMIAKAEYPENEDKNESRKESGDMPLSNLTPEEQATFKALQAKINGKAEKADVNNVTPENWIDEGDTKKGEGLKLNKSDMPEFVLNALKKSEEFIEAQELREQTEIAKKYEILGEKAEELGKQLYDLKKSDNGLYETSIAMLDRQVEAINKSGLFTEIGKSGSASSNDGDIVSKVETVAKSLMEKENIDYHSAMVKAWETHPEYAAEYNSEYYNERKGF